MTTKHLTVMSYNIKHLELGADAVVRAMRNCDPDIVAIQEPPKWWRGRRKTRALAKAAGMVCVATGGWPANSGSTALFVTPELASEARSSVKRALPWKVWWLAPKFASRRGYCAVDVGGWVVFSVHLGLNARERALHRNIIIGAAQGFGPERCVIAGDLNETPDGPSWSAFTRRLRDTARADTGSGAGSIAVAATYPAHKPRLRIDAILVGQDISVLEYQVLDTGLTRHASDHLPVVAVLGTTTAKNARK